MYGTSVASVCVVFERADAAKHVHIQFDVRIVYCAVDGLARLFYHIYIYIATEPEVDVKRARVGTRAIDDKQPARCVLLCSNTRW